MIAEVKDAWLSALESNEYEQGYCWLRRENKFCCWGVLMDVLHKKFPDLLRSAGFTWVVGAHHSYVGSVTGKVVNTLNRARLPRKLLQALEIDPWSKADAIAQTMTLNDIDKKSLSEIATHIRENF